MFLRCANKDCNKKFFELKKGILLAIPSTNIDLDDVVEIRLEKLCPRCKTMTTFYMERQYLVDS